MVRSILLVILLSGLAWWLHGEQERGRFRQVDEGFLDFLLANTRQELKPDPTRLGDVVLVRLREEDKNEYAGWPPLPIDYQMIVKNLAAHEPAVLVMAEPLHWPEPKPQFIDQLAQTLLPLPRVVLAAGAGYGGEPDRSASPIPSERLPAIRRADDAAGALPKLTNWTAAPEAELARQSDVGVVIAGSQASAARSGDRVVPSLELQALSNAGQVPFDRVRLTTGPGAGVHLGDEWFVPTLSDGQWTRSDVVIKTVNALDLLVPDVNEAGEETSQALGKGKTLVIGIDNDSSSPTAARLTAKTIASALALPRLHALSNMGELSAWGVAALLGLSLLRWPKHKALSRALLFLFIALTTSYLAFQNFQIWCPPAIPAALIAASGVLVRLFGRRHEEVPTTEVQ
jgi:hypothetical protein